VEQIILYYLDITDRKLAEQEKEKLEARLRQAQKLEAMGTLAGGIAHDFNNILQPILGYTDMALDRLEASDPLRDNMEQVLKAAQRAKELVKQILDVSHSTAEQQRTPTEVGAIAEEVMKLLRSVLPTSIEIKKNIETGFAMAEATQIHQVLMNLCINAAHAMDDRGILEITLTNVALCMSDCADPWFYHLKPGPYLRLSVSDTGCGMEKATMERIFDPYFTTKEVGKGSGLGLAVVNGIVKRHEGAVTVESDPGKGARFNIYLPRIEPRSAAPVPADSPLPRGSEKILLVDDELTVLEVGIGLLNLMGYEVTSLTDSVGALQLFRSNPDNFDLIISDCTMPGLTGVEFATEVRRLKPRIPILLCTGYSEKIASDNVKKLGIELLMKPYSLRQIAGAVRKILDAQKEG
jgi:nitrogen-specific signal transduction histidine kinase/ActR/RegA family two-component response regulator